MKVIVTGGTGFLGGAVIQHCLDNPSVSQIWALTRRPLPATLTATDSSSSSNSNNKLTNIVLDDFSSLPDSVLSQLAGADACIWSLGVTPRKGKGVVETYRTVDVKYTQTAARAFIDKLQPQLDGGKRKFRFVFVSGITAERDQSKPLWVMGAPRYSKGEGEQKLLDLAAEKSSQFEAFIARSGAIRPHNTWLPNMLLRNMVYGCRSDQMAAALTDIAMNGFARDTVLGPELSALGMKLVP